MLSGQLEYPKTKRNLKWLWLLLIPVILIGGFALWKMVIEPIFPSPTPIPQPIPTPTPIPHPPPQPEARVNLFSPNGGESWFAGATVEIVWEAGGEGMDWFNLHYSTDGGNSWRLIRGDRYTGSSSPYPWKVPSENSNNCYVRVMFLTPDGKIIAQDINKGPFSIHTK